VKATSGKITHLIIHGGGRVDDVVTESNGDHLGGVTTEEARLQPVIREGEVGGRFPQGAELPSHTHTQK